MINIIKGTKPTQTHLIDFIIVRLICTLSVLHLLDHVRVETEAKCVLVVDQRLEDEV